MVFEEVLQFVFGQAGVFFDDEHFDCFTGVFVRYADDRAFEHFRMHDGDVFNFVRVHVKAGNEHHVLFTVNDFNEALLVHDADVARAEKAVGGHDFCGFIRALPVASHNLRAANGDFSRCAVGYFFAVVI